MISNFAKSCIGFMTHDFWSRFFLVYLVGKPSLYGLISTLIFAVIIGVVALIALPISGSAAALAILIAPSTIEGLMFAAAPLIFGVFFLAVYATAWVGTLVVMGLGVTIMGAGILAYELGSAIKSLFTSLLSSKSSLGSPNTEIRLGVNCGLTPVLATATNSSTSPQVSPSSTRTSKFFPSATETEGREQKTLTSADSTDSSDDDLSSDSEHEHDPVSVIIDRPK